jgi:hypothetical protein
MQYVLSCLSLLHTQSSPRPIALSPSLPALYSAYSVLFPKAQAGTAWEL